MGRYKAVDDPLAHNIEAFSGMQKILFGRALAPTPGLHFEVLDIDVPRGTNPLTVALGWAGEINILDIGRMPDVCRYQNITVDAKSPAEVYPDQAVPPETYLEFRALCVRRLPQVNFADRRTGRVYLHLVNGGFYWRAGADDDEHYVYAIAL